MKLSEKEVQELKEKETSIEDLNEKYLYTKKDGANVVNILKLLSEKIYSFKEFLYRHALGHVFIIKQTCTWTRFNKHALGHVFGIPKTCPSA